MESIFDIAYQVPHTERLRNQLSLGHKPLATHREPALTARQRRNMKDMTSVDKLVYLRNIGSKQS